MEWNDDTDTNNNECTEAEDDIFVMIGGGRNKKVGLNVNLELIEDSFNYIEIGEDLLRIEIVEESKVHVSVQKSKIQYKCS